MRVAIAGCGRIAELGHVPALEGSEGLELAALIDPDPGRRAALGPGVATYPEVGAALARERFDLLVCCAPAAHHLEIASLAAAAGIPTLVEKPPAADIDDAVALAALSPLPWIGFNRRFDQGIALAAAIPARGRVEMSLSLSYRRRAWAPHEASDDALLDLGAHLVDLALFLTDSRPISVRRARLDGPRASFDLETSRGRAAIACAQDRPHHEAVEIRDGRGRLLGRRSSGWRTGFAARLARRPHPLVASLRRQLEAVAAGGSPIATAAEGVVVMRVLEAARESARRNGAEVIVEGVWDEDAAA